MDIDRSVLAQIAELNRMDFKTLKKRYILLIGREPPSRTRKQVIARIAYRIQEIAYGGLSREMRTWLENIHEMSETDGKSGQSVKKEHKKTPVPGTRLVRDYLGVTHEVTVCDNGFEYQGVKYRSLSAITQKITGSHTSGPAFFGLSRKGGAK